MPRPPGNRLLKAARLASGFGSQEGLAAALSAAAEELGLRGVSIGPRQVRRWESADPPWPQPHHQQILMHVLGLRMDELGFVAPWSEGEPFPDPGRLSTSRRPTSGGSRQRPTHPPSVASDYVAVTAAHRRMYWSVDPARLLASASEQVGLGALLLRETDGTARDRITRALAESALLVGRIEFFDLRRTDAAAETYVRALQFAGEADDQLLGAAILAHAAFVPGWAGDREGATERLAAARAYGRRGSAPALMRAWIDAVEAECVSRCGDPNAALGLISRAEAELAVDVDAGLHPVPDWMNWFTPVRLAAFKGNTELAAGHIKRARTTLTAVLDALPAADVKQRSVVLGDLAAVAVAAGDVEEACRAADAALDELSRTWYETGMDRIRDVRRSLRQWQDQPCVRALDDRLYGWATTLNAISGR
ncbi:transcriptional regulator [Pseudonocardia sp. KRD-169]|uniref:Transcriptional regulator n=1 Tax=Pseudonocardia abyssalis TaxID=2792008 RepID=A0ABS6UMX8_9PSEU|nr:transcriptional regulator [Pseudonocardia abyssalis]MBW0133301.1 transcriptional regulator [Pseudonocardia abyssalis]